MSASPGAGLGGRPLRVQAAHSSRLQPLTGEGWLAVGEAACSHDPLSASGIARALNSGIHTARALDALLRKGNVGLLAAYDARQRQAFDLYCTTLGPLLPCRAALASRGVWRRRYGLLLLDPRSRVQWAGDGLGGGPLPVPFLTGVIPCPAAPASRY